MRHNVGQLINYATLANPINVSVDTIRRWISALNYLYYRFLIRPWFKNVPKSLRKQPKFYLWDWSLVPEQGAKNENFIASHLLKAAQFWTDGGFGEYEVFFLRDKMKRKVDFLVTRENKPFILFEVKSSSNRLSPNLEYF